MLNSSAYFKRRSDHQGKFILISPSGLTLVDKQKPHSFSEVGL